MSDGQGKILATLEFFDDSDSLTNDLGKCLDAESRIISGPTAELMGTGADAVILILGSRGAIAACSRIIIAWINANKARKIKINGAVFDGYSAEDVVRILSTTPTAVQLPGKAETTKDSR